MTKSELCKLIQSVPKNTKFYFKVPECSNIEGEELAINTFEYNAVLNMVTLGWDCPANYEETDIDYTK